MEIIRIRDVRAGKVELGSYSLQGWIRTHRRSKNVAFIELNDGTSAGGLQLVIDPALEGYDPIAAELNTGASIQVQGDLVESPAKGQKFEFQVSQISLIGGCDAESYPLQKKRHTLEFLREQLHLRSRSNTFGAVARLRSTMALLVHEFFGERGFVYLHTPIITTADCEGAGEMFQVTTLDPESIPLKDGKVDYAEDFFKARAGLTVSGQLEAETYACGLGNVYTFGPTFRAENSNTTRHLSEFWMIEPEMAFCDLEQDMSVARDFVVSVLKGVFERCEDEIDFFRQRDWTDRSLFETLAKVVDSPFEVMTYTDAVAQLEKSGRSFEFPVGWGMDLQAEHERYLTDELIKGPLFVVDYPAEKKAFYMRMNEDGKTVRAMDLLVPRLGEIIGGSQREERHDLLAERMKALGLSPEEYWWYLDLRKYGTVPHSGFGLGFERFIMYVSGMQNIRDVIAYPRFPGFASV